MSMIRSRWAAIGAAVAVTLGAGGIGLVSATSPSGAATFVPITPCRVIDTRPDFQVGPKSSPLGPGETFDVTATGTSGQCNSVPASATGVVLNVTATDATLLTFLTIWETDQDQPDASSLNPSPGQPPTPNAVTTGINGNGEFSIFNLQGNVHVLADIVGYYTDHHHDDRYYTEDEADERFVVAEGEHSLSWLIINPGGSVRASSPDLAETLIFRPPSEPVGIYCIVFPDEVSVERNAIVATIEDGVSGVQDWGISVNSTINTACSEDSAQWDVTVTTTRTAAGVPDLDNAVSRLLIPVRR